MRERLYELRVLDRPRWRALDMTAERFRRSCEAAGLQCISQEIVNWTTRRLIDCFSVVTRPTSRWARPNRVLREPRLRRRGQSGETASGVVLARLTLEPGSG